MSVNIRGQIAEEPRYGRAIFVDAFGPSSSSLDFCTNADGWDVYVSIVKRVKRWHISLAAVSRDGLSGSNLFLIEHPFTGDLSKRIARCLKPVVVTVRLRAYKAALHKILYPVWNQ